MTESPDKFFKELFVSCHSVNIDNWGMFERAALNSVIAILVLIIESLKRVND
jgi:hypothetical protein